MKWLVTGGAGFIGSNFLRVALAAEPRLDLVNLDALTYSGRRENLTELEGNARHRFVHGDICDAVKLDDVLAAGGFDAMVHFAAES
ncbi:MAG: GDP-mannose 4,6-dehydratase, partial [Terriglobales bacterium]